MNLRNVFIACATGASLAYVSWRALQLSRPPAPVTPDAKAYGKERRALAVANVLRSTASGLAFAYGPLAPALARTVKPLPVWLRPAAFSTIASLGTTLLELPVTVVEDYEIERRYGLTDQSRSAFLRDLAKSVALETALMALLATLGGAALRKFPRSWPLIASAGAFPLYVLANLIVPLYIMPLFNRFEPVRGPLEAQLRALASEYGVGDAEILAMDMSRQTKKANAFVTGIGSTHRIVLGDTLVNSFEPDEIQFVIAHELGHYVSGDTWRLIAVAETATAALLFAIAVITNGDRSDDSVKLARAATLLGAGVSIVRPALAAFSRSREWAADRFALEATNDPEAGAAAFRRLRDQNLAEDDVPEWYEFFFGTHPSLGKRIAALTVSS